MNIDDPKLTAFALDELDEPDKSVIASEVAKSPEAQRCVDGVRKLAQSLKKEFAAELQSNGAMSRSLIDIRDDPWFWSRARPLAIAALLALAAIIVSILVFSSRREGTHDLKSDSGFTMVEAEEPPNTETTPTLHGPDNVANPLRAAAVAHIDRVVIGELETDPSVGSAEIRLIETINDAYRVERLKERLTTPILSKKLDRGLVGRSYELMFLDKSGRVVASASFYNAPRIGFVLQPSKFGYERDGHYFPKRGKDPLPGAWKSDVNYSEYVIPFPDWSECVGYSPGV